MARGACFGLRQAGCGDDERRGGAEVVCFLVFFFLDVDHPAGATRENLLAKSGGFTVMRRKKKKKDILSKGGGVVRDAIRKGELFIFIVYMSRSERCFIYLFFSAKIKFHGQSSRLFFFFFFYMAFLQVTSKNKKCATFSREVDAERKPRALARGFDLGRLRSERARVVLVVDGDVMMMHVRKK